MKTEEWTLAEASLGKAVLRELELRAIRGCIAELRRTEHSAAALHLETLLSEKPENLLTIWVDAQEVAAGLSRVLVTKPSIHK